jgi:hypothetical protein
MKTLPVLLHTYIEEKCARVRQMWLQPASDRSRRDVREFLSEASTAANTVFCFAYREKT